MVEFRGMVAPSNSSRGAQAGSLWCTSATSCSSLLSTEEACTWPLAVFYCFGSFWGTTSPSLASSFSFLFFLRLGMGSRLPGGGGGGEEWERAGTPKCPWTWIPLPCPQGDLSGPSSSVKPSLLLPPQRSIRATMRSRVRTPEVLSNSSSTSEMWMIGSPYFSLSSLSWN